jgi:hypothetical protein
LLSNLKEYIRVKLKSHSKTARLGFSTEKELLNICVKLFTPEFKQMPVQRRLLSILWGAIQEYRVCTRAPTQLNETPLCYSEFPTPVLVAYFCFKLGLICRGKDFGTGYMLHKAVFEGNLPLVSRILNCQSDKFIFAERNQLDESGNTPLMLAVKL